MFLAVCKRLFTI